MQVAVAIALNILGGAGCETNLETGTPQATLATAQRLVEEGSLDRLPALVYIEARPITYADGVTEASAIEDVRGKLSDMLGQLARVSGKLRAAFPDGVAAEGDALRRLAGGGDFGAQISRVILDPFAFLSEQGEQLEAEDLGDGTAALTYEDEPVAGGLVSMIETDDGWRFTVPVELARSTDYWPESRHEWSVIASMMLAVENALGDIENELDEGGFRNLDHAGERIGRLLGESVVVQSIIYASMKKSGKGADAGS